ncbi:MAG: hypothetical protein Q4G50_07460 [Corynebacterium sp.]|uniref:hypothetical protein n=1 Tax=Corynebacterium sp. TaxID=1720 RepID=UPI0026E06C4B|nr:hypothetical protein [Corynebacterium sp.]MDO5669825.1 hypothetical protein [Corynebacterium sp.]
MSGYDWGVAPQQPAGSTPVAPAPQQKRGVPKGALIAGGAILGVVALGFGGLMAASAMRGGPDNPAGVSDEQAASYFDGYSLSTCDFGEEFYEKASIHEVEVTENGCVGWTIPEEGQPSVRVWMEETEKEHNSNDSTAVEGVPGWSQVTGYNDRLPGNVTYATTHTSEQFCRAWSSSSRIGDWVLASPGGCGVLTPLAGQLENLNRQQTWNDADRGFFDFDEHPGYLEVSSPNASLYTTEDWTAGTTVDPGSAIASEQSDFSGSTVAVGSVRIEGDQICLDATFTLGENSSRYSNTFHLPSFTVQFATAERAPLQDSVPSRLELQVGESYTYQACGQAPVTVRGADLLVEDSRGWRNANQPAWRFPASQVAGGETA